MAPAEEGVHAGRNGHVEAGRGGVALGIRPDLCAFIKKEGALPGGRAAWACVDHPAWGRLGLVGVYGPDENEGRCFMVCTNLNWNLISHITGFSYMGDLNMTTTISDQRGGVGSFIGGREAGMWARMIHKFNLLDTFYPEGNSLRFS